MNATWIVENIVRLCAPTMAALAAAACAGQLAKKYVSNSYRSFSDKEHELKDILRTAKHDVYFVVLVGDNMLSKYQDTIRKLLRRGITVNYLLSDLPHCNQIENYVSAPDWKEEKWRSISELLFQIKKEYPKEFHIRVFDNLITTSYIGIDIESNQISNCWLPSSLIHIMPYQYNIQTKKSPIFHIAPKQGSETSKEFNATTDCIFAMWENAKPISDVCGVSLEAPKEYEK